MSDTLDTIRTSTDWTRLGSVFDSLTEDQRAIVAYQILSFDRQNRMENQLNELGMNNIDISGLSCFFNSEFRGVSGTLKDMKYFDKFCASLRHKRIGKDAARLARMVFDSSFSIKMPRKFRDWHKMFCSLTGNDYIEYDYSKLEPTEELQDEFSYLMIS